MKKGIIAIIVLIILVIIGVVVGITINQNKQTSEKNTTNNLQSATSINQSEENSKLNSNLRNNSQYADTTRVNLKIGDVTIPAVLNNTVSAKHLISRLPETVKMSRYVHDYCGGINPVLDYAEDELGYGWKNGDIAFWKAGDDFTILFDDEDISEEYGDLVIMGHVEGELDTLKSLENSIEVTIELAENNDVQVENKNKNEAKDMKISVKDSNNHNIIFELNDSNAAKSLYEQLPLTIRVDNFSSNEKIFYPQNKLNTNGTPTTSGGGSKGTLAYYAPWGDVVMFYDSFGSASGLYELGKAVQGENQIENLSGDIVIEKVEN